jgi:hypothetical protein
MLLMGFACGPTSSRAGDRFGSWKVNPARSTGRNSSRESLTVRFEPHARGEVFTVERIDGDGRSTISSTILYFDGKARDFQDFECSGTQSSRRLDGRTVEIRRTCGSGEWTWIVRQPMAKPKELVIDITEKRGVRSTVEWRAVLDKQEDK